VRCACAVGGPLRALLRHCDACACSALAGAEWGHGRGCRCPAVRTPSCEPRGVAQGAGLAAGAHRALGRRRCCHRCQSPSERTRTCTMPARVWAVSSAIAATQTGAVSGERVRRRAGLECSRVDSLASADRSRALGAVSWCSGEIGRGGARRRRLAHRVGASGHRDAGVRRHAHGTRSHKAARCFL